MSKSLFDFFLNYSKANPEQIAVINSLNDQKISINHLSSYITASELYRDKYFIFSSDPLEVIISIAAGLFKGKTVILFNPELGLLSIIKHILRDDNFGILYGSSFRFFRLLKYIIHGIEIAKLNGNNINSLPISGGKLITYTSGSQGKPKKVIRTESILKQQLEIIRESFKFTSGNILFTRMPIFALAGLACGMTIAWNNKHKMVESLNSCVSSGSNAITLVLSPFDLNLLCISAKNSNKLYPEVSQIFTGGGPVYPDILINCKKIFPNAVIKSVYGCTEAEPVAQAAGEDIIKDAQLGILAGKIEKYLNVAIRPCGLTIGGEIMLTLPDNKVPISTGDAGYLDKDEQLHLLGPLSGVVYGLYFPFQVEKLFRQLGGRGRIALLSHHKKTMLVADQQAYSYQQIIQNVAKEFEANRIIQREIPLDARHSSKICYYKLNKSIF